MLKNGIIFTGRFDAKLYPITLAASGAAKLHALRLTT